MPQLFDIINNLESCQKYLILFNWNSKIWTRKLNQTVFGDK